MKSTTISMINFKGGCTKTSSVVGLGSALAEMGKKVLLVDCDPQGHVSMHLGIGHENLELTLMDVLGSRHRSAANAILDTDEDNLFVVPATRDLLHARYSLSDRPRRDAILASALKPIKNKFDFVLIDTPPDEGLLSVNALYASRYFIIPTTLDVFSLTGIRPLIECLHLMREAYPDRKLDLMGVLINRYDARLKTQNNKNMDELSEQFGDKIFETHIRADEEIRKAQAQGQTIFKCNPKSKGASDFAALAEEIVNKVITA
jgi:chromosome partitioning protein